MFLNMNIFLLLLAPAVVFAVPLTADIQDRGCNSTCIDESMITAPKGHSHAVVEKRAGSPSLWYEYWQTTDLCKNDLGGHRCLTSACGKMQVIQLNGDGFTLNGKVEVSITRRSDFGTIWYGTLTALHYDGYRDGAWGAQTNALDCALQPGRFPPTPAFMAARDVTTNKWAPSINIQVGCNWDIQIHGASY